MLSQSQKNLRNHIFSMVVMEYENKTNKKWSFKQKNNSFRINLTLMDYEIEIEAPFEYKGNEKDIVKISVFKNNLIVLELGEINWSGEKPFTILTKTLINYGEYLFESNFKNHKD